MTEPIVKCRRCHGEGILPGPVACSTCKGEGIRAREAWEVVIKICRGCGSDFTEADWRRLPYVGEQGDGAGGVLELRNCHCSSTIAIQLPVLELGAIA